MFYGHRIAVIIPALNEAPALPGVVAEVPAWVDRILVVDNHSDDDTASVARQLGVEVCTEARRGYGWACMAGIRAADTADIVVILDGDGSEYPQAMDRLVEPIAADRADFVLGSRTLGTAQPGALTPQQRLGNRLATTLIRWRWRHAYTDMGPFRAIRRTVLLELHPRQMTYGWNVEMQIRAVRAGLRVREVPMDYRKRIGRSKISGTVRGVLTAGTVILRVIALEALRRKGKDAQ